jgi:hypothetical protein
LHGRQTLLHTGQARLNHIPESVMARFLIFTGIILVVAGLLWPFIAKLGLGRLPGDIAFTRGNTTFYFPIMTSILLSVVLSAVLWMLGR